MAELIKFITQRTLFNAQEPDFDRLWIPGAGYAGKMLSMAAKKFGLKCKIFMGAKDIKRQRPNVEAIRKNGAEIVSVTTGSQTLVDAVSECMRYWFQIVIHICVGSTVGPNIFIKICAWSTAQISRELMKQVKEEFEEYQIN